ncbi:exopolysaccharide biosynthesis polyprenyl glycosylphosphotransferase [Nitratidesulfovibrio vulgaris RCH1]|nr:exopolysaccharide biosynthesis polyprenyl glycosylphosphotransferase [Nitratidesulfovibrio vulgaris RCH1]
MVLSFLKKFVENHVMSRHTVAVTLFLTDMAVILGTAIGVGLLRHAFDGYLDPTHYLRLLPFLLLFPAASFAMGLYQSVPLPPPCELKRLSLATCCTYLAIAIFIFFTRGGELYSRLTFALAGLVSLVAVPVARHLVRQRMARHRGWAAPALLFGKPHHVQPLAHILLSSPSLGLEPVAIVSAEHSTCHDFGCLPAFDAETTRQYAAGHPEAYAIVVMESYDEADRAHLVEHLSRLFCSVILLRSSTMSTGNIWLSPIEIGGLPGLMVRQNLLDPRRLTVKRTLDLIATTLALPLILPVMAVIALCIRLETPGPALFTQRRIGRDGYHFDILKFRTMYNDADTRLAECLEQSPELDAEWRRDHKLRCDPRVTRVGAFLRKTSLDELPQLWNVLRGDMSLVGPRPIVDSEVQRYDAAFATYTRVRPGITGLWQVSGRNNLSYPERVQRDMYYISNWSVWFDIWIIARTIPVVLHRDGAY